MQLARLLGCPYECEKVKGPHTGLANHSKLPYHRSKLVIRIGKRAMKRGPRVGIVEPISPKVAISEGVRSVASHATL